MYTTNSQLEDALAMSIDDMRMAEQMLRLHGATAGADTRIARAAQPLTCAADDAIRSLASRCIFRSSSDSISFSKNESESCKSARGDS